MITSKKLHPKMDRVFVVEHLEKSSPLIEAEIARWRDLLWDDYLDNKRDKERSKKLLIP